MICFCFPVKPEKPGGVQSMIINIAKFLHKNDILFKTIDYDGGYIDKRLKSFGIKYLLCDLYQINPKEIRLDKDDVIVVFGQYEQVWNIIKYQNCRIFFWEVLPKSFHSIFNVRKSFKEKYFKNWLIPDYFIRKFINKAVRKNGLAVINGACAQAYEPYTSLSRNIPLLPIPIDIKDEKNQYRHKITKQAIRVTYIGRGSNWKVIPLRNVCKGLIDLKHFDHITVNVVTEDKKEYESILNETLQGYSLSISYFSGFSGEKLIQFLLSNTDVSFAMGTSALEAARLGIPTVLVDAWESDYPEGYRFLWLYETESYLLGERLWENKDYKKGHSLKDVVETLCNDEIISVSDKCLEYCRKHFLNTVGADFIKLTNESALTVKDLKWLIHYVGFKNKIYKIIN